MRLEYLEVGSNDCPLVRLYDFSIEEVSQLQQEFNKLAKGGPPIDVESLAFVRSIAECKLRCFVNAWDQALKHATEPNSFTCGLTKETWDNVAALVEPFVDGAVGYQWLVGVPGEADLLLSKTGEW